MKLKPTNDKIVVKPHVRVLSTIIAVENNEEYNTGTVVAVGPGGWDSTGKKREVMPVEIGETVRFGTMGDDEYLKYTPYTEDGEKYLLMSWKDVCFVEEAA